MFLNSGPDPQTPPKIGKEGGPGPPQISSTNPTPGWGTGWPLLWCPGPNTGYSTRPHHIVPDHSTTTATAPHHTTLPIPLPRVYPGLVVMGM